MRDILDDGERAQADRFRFDVHRRRFTIGRAYQRLILGAYLLREPTTIRYTYSPNGKPYIAEQPLLSSVSFNFSNSSDLALLAIVRKQEIGIDIERIDEIADLERLASHFFSRREADKLLTLPHELQLAAFFRCWTRKEAYLKAVGHGLSMPLDSFDVSLTPDEGVRILAIRGDVDRAKAWSLFHLDPAQGYIGAVAIEGDCWQLSVFETSF
jgi:4'-phosphopantetheinyl transferase